MTERPPAFLTRLEAYAFLRARIDQSRLTRAAINRRIGAPSNASLAQLIDGRKHTSRSKYFDGLCEVLSITQAEREAFCLVDRREPTLTSEKRIAARLRMRALRGFQNNEGKS